jgi:60S ribosomal subunit assembly/export protein LOC1
MKLTGRGLIGRTKKIIYLIANFPEIIFPISNNIDNYTTMAPSRTKTVKSKHAANKSGIRNSKNSTKPQIDGVSKSKKPPKSKAPPLKSSGGQAKKKRRIYTEEELGIPTLNMVTPVGVEKPKGRKKGKVFVDDKVCTMNP